MTFTPKFVDLVRNFTTVLGSAPVTLGAAVNGYTGIAGALSTGDQFYYCIQGVEKPQEREVGRGTLQANGTVAREAITGGLTHFTSGTKTIALVAAAEWFSKLEQGGGGGAGAAAVDVSSRSELASWPTSGSKAALLTEAGREGMFVWKSSDLSAKVASDPRQGIYVAPAADPTGAGGAWVRTGWDAIDCAWFGTVGDDATDDAPAINAAFAAAEALGFTVDYGWATPPVRLKKGEYFCASSLIPQQTTRFCGDGGKGDAGGSATVIRFAANCHGIDLKYDSGIRAPSISIEGLHLIGAYTNYASEGEYHGIKADVRFRARDIYISTFQGDGIHIEATAEAGNSFLENTNNFVIEDCWVAGCRNGLYIVGADANAGSVARLSANFNRRWGVFDASFLGNLHTCHHADGNGIFAASDVPPNVVSHSGNRYCVVHGQEANASTNAPSGTTADTAYWLYISAGGIGTPDLNIPAWSNGMTLRSGGSYLADGTNGGMAFIDCYAEGGQGHNQFGNATFVAHGQLPRRHIGSIWADNRGVATKQLSVDGNLTVIGPSVQIGGLSGPPADVGVSMYATGFNLFWAATSAAGAVGSLQFSWGAGTIYDISNAGWAHYYRVNGANVMAVNGAGLNLYAGKVLTVDGNQVVGPRGAAVADATDAASAITQLNALLSRCRAHGLIAS